MSLFKKKIKFAQFVADEMKYQFDFIEKNFDKFIELDDEYKALTLKDKEEIHSLVDVLILADLFVGCSIHLSSRIASSDIGDIIGEIYISKYLNEYKKIGMKEIDEKNNKMLDFFDFFLNYREQREKDIEERKKSGGHPVEIKNDAEKMQADLCVAFAEYYTDKIASNQQKETKQGRNFAAFKFAMAIVKTDLIGTSLREHTIDWS